MMMLRTRTAAALLASIVTLGFAVSAPAQEAEATKPVDYLKDVRPILSQHCYDCHGPDEAKRKADLRLDLRADAMKAIDEEFFAIKAGSPADSMIIERITTDDKDEVMPPAKLNDALSKQEIAILTRWIEEGAKWEEHWAFQPPVKEAPPEVKDLESCVNAIDNFALAKLEQKGLGFGKRATREAIIRRVTFDLTGMPPTTEEIDAFMADKKEGAYERLVDRLLASKRFGERQAQEWLDAARYADSNGYQSDSTRIAWQWREWVIKALNSNMPFDQFATEQLAGDLLPNATIDQKIATGFNRNHPTNSEAGSEIDEYRSQYVIDRLNTTATTFLGLTVACAQCHDHKFDPIPQKDFYKFYAFFNQVDEVGRRRGFGRNPKPSVRVPNPDQAPHVALLDAKIKELEERLDGDDSYFDLRQAAWEEKARKHVGEDVAWKTAEPIGLLAHHGSILRVQDDGSILASGEPPVRDVYDMTFKPGDAKIAAIRIEVLPDPSQPKGSSGRSRKGQFILSGFKVRVTSLSDSTDSPLMYVAKADADLNQERPEVYKPDSISPGSIVSSIIVEETNETQSFGRTGQGRGWSIIGDERYERHESVIVPLETLKLNKSSVVRLTLEQKSRPFKSLIGRFRVSFTDDERIRTLMLPAHGKEWSAIGPFKDKDVKNAHKTVFTPEKELKKGMDLKKEHVAPVVEEKKGGPPSKGGFSGSSKASSSKGGGSPSATPKKKPAASPAKPDVAGTQGKPSSQPPTAKKAQKPVADEAGKGSPKKGGFGKGSFGKGTFSKDGFKKGQFPKGGFKKGTFGKGAFAKGKGSFKKGAGEDAAAKQVQAGKTEVTAQKSSAKQEEKKDTKKKPAKSSSVKKSPAGKPEGTATASAGSSSSNSRRTRKPAPLKWEKHREWRDGRRISLAKGNVAWYLTRKIHSTRARTVTMRFDGPDGVKAWLNGELIFEAAPKDAPAPTQTSRFSGFSGFSRSRRPSTSDDRKVQIGLREGESELVVKVVYGPESRRRSRSRGGSSTTTTTTSSSSSRNRTQNGTFTFQFEPEGEDVVSHEVTQALRELDPLEVAKTVSADKPESKKAKRIARMRKSVRKHYRRTINPIGLILARELEKLKGEKRSLEGKMPEALVMEELSADKMRKTNVFIRGDYRHKGEEVSPGTPSALPPMADDLPKNRLGLARWLVSGQNPLTARVTVNRIWQQYFGKGFVATPEDFGIRSESPTHAKLLDWLALEFVRSGWDMKHIHKLIVMSSVYRQSALAGDDVVKADPDNELLSRGPALRLSAEMIRDNALAVSGLLVEKIGGESVRPYQPPGLWQAVSSGGRGYRKESGPNQYRRGLYVFWKRGVPYPSMTTFDAAKRDMCTVSRPTTTTPLQALVLLNDPVYVEAAKMLGQRMLKEGGDDDAARLSWGYRTCVGRAIDKERLKVLSELLAAQRKHYQDNEKDAAELLKIGDAKVDESVAKAEAAAWTAVGSALLNLDQTIHR